MGTDLDAGNHKSLNARRAIDGDLKRNHGAQGETTNVGGRAKVLVNKSSDIGCCASQRKWPRRCRPGETREVRRDYVKSIL
jgi:hypothetical protein